MRQTRGPALIACGLVAIAACSRTPTATTTAAPDAAPSASESASANDDIIVPVYPVDAGPPDPRAQRFCDAILVLPEKRKAECCGNAMTATATTIAGQCTRTLTSALSAHAVMLTPEDVDTCVAEMTRVTTACDWVAPSALELPPACHGLIHGMLPARTRCRSSLECAGALRCQGLSTIDVGVCGPSKPASALCNSAIDMLVTFTRQDDADHPECAGFCARSRCKDAVASGGACKSDVECGRGRCEIGRCTSARLPTTGEPCTTLCAYGNRCSSGKCAAAKVDGGACK